MPRKMNMKLGLIEKVRRRFETDPRDREIAEARDEYDKRMTQNSRILSEFPWLWAVRPAWEMALDSLTVTDSSEYNLVTSAAEDIREHPLRIRSLWAHSIEYTNGLPLESVDCIWENPEVYDVFFEPDVTWEGKLKAHTDKTRSKLLHVATISGGPYDFIYIIRPRKPHRSFNAMWQRDSFVRS